MRERTFRVLLTDYIGYDSGVEMPYILTQAGSIVDVYATGSSWLLKNKYWDTWFPANVTDPEEFATELERIVREGNYDWVVPIDDMVIRIMNDRITDEDLFYKILPLSKIENRAFLGSKAELSRFAERNAIPTPAFAVYDGSRSLEELGAMVGYPLILKIDRSQGSDGVFKCNSYEALHEAFEKIPEQERRDLVLQKFIPAKTLSCEALYKNGRLLAYAPSTMEVFYDKEFGISVVRKYTPHRMLEPLLVKIGERLGASGFGNSTFMYDETTGEYYFIELDLRPQVWFSLNRFAGVDFSEASRNFLTDTYHIIRPNMTDDHPVFIRHFVRDIMYSLKKGDIGNLLYWMFNLDGRWKFIPFHDPVFLLAVAQQAPKTLIAKVASFLPRRRKK